MINSLQATLCLMSMKSAEREEKDRSMQGRRVESDVDQERHEESKKQAMERQSSQGQYESPSPMRRQDAPHSPASSPKKLERQKTADNAMMD